MLLGTPFSRLAVGASRLADSAVVIAACRAGAVGCCDLAGKSPAVAAAEIAEVRRYTAGFGLRFDAAGGPQPGEFDLEGAVAVILAGYSPDALTAAIAAVHGADRAVIVEVLGPADIAAARAAGADGLLGRGHESGGRVSAESAFILAQRLARDAGLPFWIAGGIGPDSAAAVAALGARGVVLDRQLACALESRLPAEVREVLARGDGSETTVIGAGLGVPYRVFDRPVGHTAVAELQAIEKELAGRPDAGERWIEAVEARLGWGPDDLWPVGQDLAFAAPLAATHRTVGGILQAVGERLRTNLATARASNPLAAGAPLAAAHGTEFPIVQGPMTRVSDTAPFAAAVAAGGGLPFLALALLDGERSLSLLRQTATALGERPWGVGILGFVPPELRAEQLAAIEQVKPPFALIAGGRPTQARQLEDQGIPTYLHVPSPRLLESFVEAGARRFIFEGRECGGHIGPRSSFVLWQQAVDVLARALDKHPGEEFWLLFAGGVHDAASAAAVSALTAPLVRAGAKVGVLLGTAYLFCAEAVAAGAIVEPFQAEAVACRETAIIETSPGHAIRIVPTPALELFAEKRRELEARGLGPREVGHELEQLNLGRLRIASKGLMRNPARATDLRAPAMMELSAEQQRAEGIYMIGQLAALRDTPTTIRALHESVAAAADALPADDLPEPAHVIDPNHCPVALVGMAALLPGASSAQAFWENILRQVDSVTEVPTDRWDPAVYFDETTRGGDKTYSKWGGFLDPIVFDPLRYGIPPNSLRTIEPVHLLALEVTRAALADAGYEQRPFRRDRTAVVFGAGGGSSDLSNAFGFRGMLAHFMGCKQGLPDAGALYEQLADVLPQWCEDTFPGVLINVIAGRIANRFDFGGANYTVDAACASSLAALDAAVKELRLGCCDVAVAGGADTTQDIFSYLLFSNSMVLSPRGRCRTFDESADGIAISEGVAAVVLKRLDDAERDGDRVYAVIRGLAGSSDGRALGLTAPNLNGQMRAVQQAYLRAEVDPGTVGLVEAHGTGTAVGDRAEVSALTKVFQPSGAAPASVAIGSVKSNIGHTKCTAGLASLIKVARALYHRVLPATLHVEQINRKAGFGANPFYPNLETRPWLHGVNGPVRRAGVSAFGFGGTNFHAVLEEYPQDYLPRRAATDSRTRELLCFEADDADGLAAQLEALAKQLEGARPALGDLAYTLDLRRRTQPGRQRLALVVGELDGLPARLQAVAAAVRAGDRPQLAREAAAWSPEPLLAEGKLAFLFCGQGSQTPHMLRDLGWQFDVARDTLEAADRALVERFPQGLSRFIYPPSAYDDQERQAQRAALTDTRVAQPALGAVCAAGLELLRWCGLEPAMAAGHSYGEYVALYAGGAFDFDTLLQLSEARGRHIADTAGEDSGTMAAVRGSADEVAAALAGMDGITLANRNSPKQTVIAGGKAAVDAALAKLKEAGLSARTIPVSCAFHSPLVAAAAELLGAELRSAAIAAPRFPVYSNTTAAPHQAGAIAELLARHLAEPVRFVDEIEAMWADGARVFCEIGPGRVLTGLVETILDGRSHLALALDQPGDGLDGLLRLLAAVWVEGGDVQFQRLYEGRRTQRLDLDQLAAATRAVIPPTAWMVAGGKAWPVAEGLTPPKPERKPAAPIPLAGGPAPAAPPAADGGDALAAFQQSMTRTLEQHQHLVREALDSQQRILEQYLDSQRAVMTAYLGGQPPEVVPATPALTAALEPADETAAAPDPPAEDDALDLLTRLVRLVAERTGYPAETLGLDLDMEAELGIDSIKRIEILGSLQEQLPGSAGDLEEHLEELAQQKTLRQVVAFLEPKLNGAPAAEPTPPSGAPTATAVAAAEPPPEVAPSPAISRTRRYVVRPQARPAVGAARTAAPGGVLITPGPAGVAMALCERLRAQGLTPHRLTDLPLDAASAGRMVAAAREDGPVRGLIHLSALDPVVPPEMAVTGAFLLLQAVAGELKQAADEAFGAMILTGAGGRFGLAGGRPEPTAAAVCGLAKAAAAELGGVPVKAIDLDPGLAPAKLADAALTEQLGGDPTVEVGLSDERVVLRCVAEPAEGTGVRLGGESVVLVLGGARGITAAIAAELARRCRPILVLVGRGPAPSAAEAPVTRGLTELGELKAALAFDLESTGRDHSPAAVESAYRALLREREVRANLAELTELAGALRYESCDVSDRAAFGALVGRLLAEYGRIDAVIHGAGIIEDKRLVDKALDSFQRVWRTKVVPAEVLRETLAASPPALMVFFGSVAGRFGNRGQVDYAAANEYLSRLAARLDADWPTRVVTVSWGPWDEVGMVAPELRAVLRQRGFELIAPADGTRLLAEEIAAGAKGEAEVVIAPLSDEGELLR